MKKYKVKYKENSKTKILYIKTDDISSYDLPRDILSIKEVINFDISNYINDYKISSKDINLIFYELDLMLNAGINLNEALNILHKNKKSKKLKEFLLELKQTLVNKNITKNSFDKFKVSYLVPAFIELSSKRGNIELNIKTLNILLEKTEESRKEFIKSITYPLVLLGSFLISMLCIFYIVVPKFKIMFEQTTNELPLATQILFFVHNIFENYLLVLFIFVLLTILLIFYVFKNSLEFRYNFDKFVIKKFYIFKKLFLYFELYKLFLTIDIMQKSGYEFHNALNASKVLLKNQYLLDKISLIENLLQNGKTIFYSFSKTDLFDDMILNLINTAEVSNSLDKTVEEITKIYQNRFNEKVKLIKALIEPIFLITIMSLIIWIVLAVFMPIWDMGNMLKN